jgi:hypothetical protein
MLTFTLLIASSFLPWDDFSTQGWDQVNLGMTRLEVYRLIGPPSPPIVTKNLDLSSVGGTFADRELRAKGEVWQSASRTLRIAFNEQGRAYAIGRYGPTSHAK